MSRTLCNRVNVLGHSIFYRESGSKSSPAILLLSGYPMSSHMFRNLIPRLSTDYHVIAPDYPGFGFTTSPQGFNYTFDSLTEVIQAFLEQIGLSKYAIYIYDYGAPIGLRLALKNPESIRAIICQNGNAYEEGLTPAWDPIKKYWKEPTAENRKNLDMLMSPDTVRELFYLHGCGDRVRYIEPETYTLDSALLAVPGQLDIQLDIFRDYASNVTLYPSIHAYFRRYQPPFIALWGKNDPFFSVAGAEAYRRDLPKAEIHFLDAGHTALETHDEEIGSAIRNFLGRLK